MTIEIVAYGAISPLGRSANAVSPGVVGERPIAANFFSKSLADGGLARPFVAGVAGFPHDEARAGALLDSAMDDVSRALDAVRPSWRSERVGVVIGTSSGGMRAIEAMVRAEEGEVARLCDAGMYFAPFVASLAKLKLSIAPASLILGACASSTLAIGLGMRWLEEGACDLVVAGGFDAESTLVAAGFEALRATTASPPPRPFHPLRDGLALGEGAALVALAKTSVPGRAALLGFGASCDAFHVTAPDPEGKGLARAAELALKDAGVEGSAIDLVSAHGTATPFNDAAEAKAILAVSQGSSPVVHAYKSQIGHTLGAAGALELLVTKEAAERGIFPASAGRNENAETGEGDLVRLLQRAESGNPKLALKLSSAFGGLNAALVLGTASPQRSPAEPRPVYIERAVVISPKDPLPSGIADVKVGRFDAGTRLALAATHRLESTQASPGARRTLRDLRAGIVVGQTVATLERNAAYAERIATRGARAAEPRAFPYTSPNAGAGEAAIAFGLTGPAFAVGAGMHAGLEAVAVASSFVRAGDAETMVVVAVDAIGEVTRSLRAARGLPAGAVALVVTSSPTSGRALRLSGVELGFDPSRAREKPLHPGHLALLPLLAAFEEWNDKLSIRLESVCTSGAFASLALDRV